MTLRVARHTTDLDRMIRFYGDILGLEVLGRFADHNGYDGVFIGIPKAPWHLEFTTSQHPPVHHPDADDPLVFYMDSAEELTTVQQRFTSFDVMPVVPKNPYWQQNGTQYNDPDGYGVIIALKGHY
ncbi:VOC family protein [Mucilaginibacter daejeonensis]|uniref:VOC family protein n=1 Tax=Mucilaginibacter daejeonensis TaxID=398049 RepID=UPI001D17680C|nr:VOC family protein [Mucilaginibacter daejeonensis]UEG53145.1 VOC family protein [Mucilaginibacter daejeonensis]